MAACTINFEDIRAFARARAERLPLKSQREWLERALLRFVLTTGHGIYASGPSQIEIAAAHVASAIANGDATFRFSPSPDLDAKVTSIVDWLAGLPERDPRLARKLRRVTFADALEMSHRWHRELRKAAGRRQKRTIPRDPVGAPWLLDATSLGPGWSWVWLKSPEARKAEGEAMGHCVGSGGYESLRPSEAVLSLRDPDSVPHVTLHLDENRMLQAVTKGNGKVGARYQAAVDRASAVIGVRLFVAGNPERAVPDGCHRRNGHFIHVRGGLLHRDDGPAVERAEGINEWYRDGKLHRDDGPAIDRAGAVKEWYSEGERHRDDGPAVEWASGDRKWYRRGELHRVDGPAIEWTGGTETKEWFLNGQRHRDDGPAVESADGTKTWYRYGTLHRDDGPAIERPDGTTEWYRAGKRHREDGPAVEWANGTKDWHYDGQRHREDGPAIEWPNGTTEWYRAGKRHREDGPAVQRPNGDAEWYRDGEKIVAPGLLR
jgi:hypothetical protein